MRKLLIGVVGATALAVGSAAGAVVTVDSSTMVISGPTTVVDTTTIGFTEAAAFVSNLHWRMWFSRTRSLASIRSR